MIKYLEKNDFNEEIKNGVTLVDFYADWCMPCQRQGEVLETLEDVNILKVNTDEHQDLASEFGVMSIPTLIVFRDGKLEERRVGLQSKDDLITWLKKDC